MVQLSQAKPGTPANRRPASALAARRYPARRVAGRIHDRTAQRPERARAAGCAGAGAGGADRTDLHRPHREYGSTTRLPRLSESRKELLADLGLVSELPAICSRIGELVDLFAEADIVLEATCT